MDVRGRRALAPLAEAADLLAAREWPRLYDAEVLASLDVPCAAAIYTRDAYVDREFSEQTAALIPTMKPWLDDEHVHNGLRVDGARRPRPAAGAGEGAPAVNSIMSDLPPSELYREFAEQQTDDSPCFRKWALGIADDRRGARVARDAARCEAAAQPRVRGCTLARRSPWVPTTGSGACSSSTGPRSGRTIMSRATQTNEVGRCATLLPLLASLPGPLALLEVGCSAGLCLFPDRYSYRFTGSRGDVAVDPVDGPSPVVLPACSRATSPSRGR